MTPDESTEMTTSGKDHSNGQHVSTRAARQFGDPLGLQHEYYPGSRPGAKGGRVDPHGAPTSHRRPAAYSGHLTTQPKRST